MRILKYAKKLVALNLAFFTPQSFLVMQKGMHYLKHCKPMEKLTIYTTLQLRGYDTKYLASLPSLATVFPSCILACLLAFSLSFSLSFSHSFSQLSLLSKFVHFLFFQLLFAGTKLTSSAMRRLAECTALKELYLHEVMVTGIT
jgi:hypothetical protein